MSETKVETEPFGEIEALLKEEEKPVMSHKLNRLFPETEKVFEEALTETAVENEILIPNIKKTASKLERDDVPKELMFICGGENPQFRRKFDMLA